VNPLLPPVDRHFPIENGRYEVKPGLRRLSGNVFQIDQQFDPFRQNKLAARAERLSKYYATCDLTPAVERAFNGFATRRLAAEYPAFFSFDGMTLHCKLTGDVLHFSTDGDFLDAETNAVPKFTSGMDALASQVQEDMAIISTADDRHWLSAVHLCSPNHWAAKDKIGKTFAAIHEPVAGIEAINLREREWVRTMVNAVDGLMRFAWGVATDSELNHHPDNPGGRQLDRDNPAAFLRVERQMIWGFPEVGASLFTIRTSFIDCAEIRLHEDERNELIAAIGSMSAASLRYKGMDGFSRDLIDWLERHPMLRL
jgi:hypothetical protein